MSEDKQPDWQYGMVAFPPEVAPATRCTGKSNSSVRHTKHGIVKSVVKSANGKP